MISIRAPRVGCDQCDAGNQLRFHNFNPRTPRGVRRNRSLSKLEFYIFQSTHPAWGATFWKARKHESTNISIHAPRVGCDCPAIQTKFRLRHFNPRTPRGVRHSAPQQSSQPMLISIHAPRVGCDDRTPPSIRRTPYFNPRTPRGVRLRHCSMTAI